jgi:hypothetical protein
VSVDRWAYDGVVLNSGNHNEVSLEDLREFVAQAERLGETAPIRLFEYGLRATRMAGTGGPHLDWR